MSFEGVALALHARAVLHVQPRDHVTRPASHDAVEQLERHGRGVSELRERRGQRQEDLRYLQRHDQVIHLSCLQHPR